MAPRALTTGAPDRLAIRESLPESLPDPAWFLRFAFPPWYEHHPRLYLTSQALASCGIRLHGTAHSHRHGRRRREGLCQHSAWRDAGAHRQPAVAATRCRPVQQGAHRHCCLRLLDWRFGSHLRLRRRRVVRRRVAARQSFVRWRVAPRRHRQRRHTAELLRALPRAPRLQLLRPAAEHGQLSLDGQPHDATRRLTAAHSGPSGWWRVGLGQRCSAASVGLQRMGQEARTHVPE